MKLGKPRKLLGVQKKHLTIQEKIQKEECEKIITLGNEQLKEPPNWLVDNIAREEYLRIIEELEKINVVGNLDLNNLGGYCNSYSFYIKASNELKNKSLLSKKISKNGPIIVKNPLIEIQKNYAEEMRKFAALCGLTIDSRLKVATEKTNKQAQDIEEKFGDI